MQTILGANGIIGEELAKELFNNYTKDIRIGGRNPSKINSTDKLFKADLLNSEQTKEAVKGSEIKRQEFLDLAYEIGFSRELMGVHYPSDEEVARELAHRILMLMWNTQKFQKDFKKAKSEWQ